MHIFYTLGAPNILQSDNGKEFDNKLLLSSLNKLWPCSKIIHGKPRYPQSQGSVESANKRTESILTSVLVKEQKTQWAEELDKVAYMKNTSLHSACKKKVVRIKSFMVGIHQKACVILKFLRHSTILLIQLKNSN